MQVHGALPSGLNIVNDLLNAPIGSPTTSYTLSSSPIKVYSTTPNAVYDLTVGGGIYQDFIRMADDSRTLPVITVTTSPVCTGGTITLDATAWGTEVQYEWLIYSGTNTASPIFSSSFNSPTATLTSTGTYNIRYRVFEQCCGWSIPVFSTVTVAPDPTINIFASTTQICSGSSVNLTATVSGTGTCNLQWQSSTNGVDWTNVGTSNPYNSGALTSNTFFRATYTCGSSGCDAITSGTVSVNVDPVPVNDLCANAIGLSAASGAYLFDNTCAGGTDLSSCGTADANDIWFAYTPIANGFAGFSLCGSSFNNTLSLWTACGGTQLACSDDNGALCAGTNASLQYCVSAFTTYFIRVAGVSGVQGTGTLNINAPTSSPPVATTNSPICAGDTLTLSVSAGSGYLWSGPDGFSSTQQNPSIYLAMAAAAGVYTVTVTDANGCTSTAQTTAIINDGPALTAVITNVSCFGTKDGAIDLSVTGTAPFSYLWSNSMINQDLISLFAGTYTVTVTDANGCSTVSSYLVTEPPLLNASLSNQNDILCNGDNTGNIDVTVSGGTPG